MKLNTSLLLIDGGTADCRSFANWVKPSELFNTGAYHVRQTVRPNGQICRDECNPNVYVIYRIDIETIDGEEFPCIHIRSINESDYRIDEFVPNVLIIGSDLNNQVEIGGIKDVPCFYSKINIHFSDRHKQNGSYRVISVDTVEHNGRVYPRIHTKKIKNSRHITRLLNLSSIQPVGY